MHGEHGSLSTIQHGLHWSPYFSHRLTSTHYSYNIKYTCDNEPEMIAFKISRLFDFPIYSLSDFMCLVSVRTLQRLKNTPDRWIIGVFSFCHKMSDIKFTFHNSNLLDYDCLYFVTHQGCPTSHHWRAAFVPSAYLPAGNIIRLFLFQYSDTDRYMIYDQIYEAQKLGLWGSKTLIRISVYFNINDQTYKIIHWSLTWKIKHLF
jgi:hypothetical protein